MFQAKEREKIREDSLFLVQHVRFASFWHQKNTNGSPMHKNSGLIISRVKALASDVWKARDRATKDSLSFLLVSNRIFSRLLKEKKKKFLKFRRESTKKSLLIPELFPEVILSLTLKVLPIVETRVKVE